MKDLLWKYRHDGKRFWYTDASGHWFPTTSTMIFNFLICNLGVSRKQATRLRTWLKSASKNIQDEIWLEEVRWFEFTKDCQFFVLADKVFFCSHAKERSRRWMKLSAFNQKLRQEFPHRRRVPEDSNIGYVFCPRVSVRDAGL